MFPLLSLSTSLAPKPRYTAVFNPLILGGISFDPQGDPRRPWLISKDHEFTLVDTRTGKVILRQEIHAGLRTDFASIPWFLGWLFPKSGWHTRACAFHDGGYDEQYAPRTLMDLGLRTILNVDRPRSTVWENIFTGFQTILIWLGVRCFGWYAWWQNQKRNREG